jgi:Domain of unknown function (DUF4265)
MSDSEETDWAAWSREAVRIMQQRNDRWTARYGFADCRYDVDVGTATLWLHRKKDLVVAAIRVVGKTSERKGTFLWSWADVILSTEARLGVERVREFGEEHGLSLLTTPEFPAGRAEALEVLAIAGRVLDAQGVLVMPHGDLTMFFVIFGFKTGPEQKVWPPPGWPNLRWPAPLRYVTLPVLDDSHARAVSAEVIEFADDAEERGFLRLLHSPARVSGLAAGDVIELDTSRVAGFRVMRRGGNLAVVLRLPTEELKGQAGKALEAEVASMSGVCESSVDDSLVFTVPSAAGIPAVEAFFNRARDRFRGSEWHFNNAYGPDGRPLDWQR